MRKNKKCFNQNPLFGGPKYENENLVKYEVERSSTMSKNSLNSTVEDPIPVLGKKERQRTKRLYINRYANRSDLTLDWSENVNIKGYQHPLGK